MIWYLNTEPVQKTQECAVPLGIQGENGVLQYTADVSDWMALWPSGVVALVLQAPDKSEPYMGNTSIDTMTGLVTWTITEFDTAQVGYGAGELRIVENGIVKKSYRFATYIRPSILASAAEPPAPVPDWITNFLETAESVNVAAAEAKQAATEAHQALQDVTAEGAAQIAAIQAKGEETITAVQSTIDSAQEAIDGIEAQRQTMIQAIASVAGQGTDTTLTQSGVAADAKAAGDQISDLKSAVNDVKSEFTPSRSALSITEDVSSSAVSGYYITTNVNQGVVVDLTPVENSSYAYYIADVFPDDKYILTGLGGQAPRLWVFVDKDNKQISGESANASKKNLVLTAPANAAKIIINCNINGNTFRILKCDSQKCLEYVGLVTENYVENLVNDSYITLNVNVGYTVSATPVTNYSFTHCIIPCKYKDTLTVTGTGASAPRLWGILDGDYKLISVATANATATDLVLTAPTDGYFVVNFDKSKTYSVTYSHYYKMQDVLTEMRTVPTKTFEWSVDEIPNSANFSDYEGIATYSPTLSELYAAYDALVTAFPDYVSKTDLGTDQSNTYHLYKYSFNPERIPVSGQTFSLPVLPKVLLGSGTHGDGTQGDKKEMVVALYYFFYNICHNWAIDEGLSYLRWNVRFEIIPVQNPWGYVNDNRRNSRGVDINRNFPYGWSSGTSGDVDYGGTSALSEAESVIIKDFIEDNTDALFYYDIHTVGSTASQNHMVYFNMLKGTPLAIPANSSVIQISKRWNSENIGGLNSDAFHGYIYGENGMGMINTWVTHKYMPASVFEGFPNFTGSTLTDEGDKIMEMCLGEMFTVILSTLRYFRYS